MSETNNKGRRGVLDRYSDKKVSVEVVPKASVIHAKEVVNITVNSLSQKALQEFLFSQYLSSQHINDDKSGAILSYVYDSAIKRDGYFIVPLATTAKKLDISYPTAQRIIKKLVDNGILERLTEADEAVGYRIQSEVKTVLDTFVASNQLVITVNHVEEEQAELFGLHAELKADMVAPEVGSEENPVNLENLK